MSFYFSANAYGAVWVNVPIGTIPPSGDPTWSGDIQRIWKPEMGEGFHRIVLPASFVAANPGIGTTFSTTTYIQIIDQLSGHTQVWLRVVNVSWETENVSTSWDVDNLFVDCCVANLLIKNLPPLANGLTLLQYPNGQPIVNSDNDLMASNGAVIVDSADAFHVNASLLDYYGSPGSSGQVLGNIGSACQWQTPATPPATPLIVYNHVFQTQTADLGLTTLLTSDVGSPYYRINMYGDVLVQDVGAGTANITLGWTDGTGPQSFVPSGFGLNSAAGPLLAPQLVYVIGCQASTAITLSVLGGGTYGSAAWSLAVFIEKIGW